MRLTKLSAALPGNGDTPNRNSTRQSGYATGQLAGESRRFVRASLLEGAYGGFYLDTGCMRDPLVPGNAG